MKVTEYGRREVRSEKFYQSFKAITKTYSTIGLSLEVFTWTCLGMTIHHLVQEERRTLIARAGTRSC